MELRAVVVIPARNEAASVADCLAALAEQSIPATAFETVLVADACTDGTEEVAVAAAQRLGLPLTVIPGPGAGSGPARRIGMDAAADRLLSAGRPDGLIATTDADSRPAPDWLARQLAHLAGGAQVVAGLIELDEAEAARLPAQVLQRRESEAARRLAHVFELEPEAAHHHFAGASLGVTAAVYRRVGGIQDPPALEDEAFASRLREHGVPVLRAADVRVSTSARAEGRARRGLSVDLAVAVWQERRRYRAEDFSIPEMRSAKGAAWVTVVIPTKRCAETIEGVLRTTADPLRQAGLVDEVVVIDAASDDGTAQRAQAAGARVVQQDEVLVDQGPALGKGDAMWRALAVTHGDLVCFLDGDTLDPDPRHLQGLLGPLLLDPAIALVKGAFDRPLGSGAVSLPHEGGRVTELMARPLLNLHEPLLAGFSQPLAGEFAARRELLEALPFPVGYGVEIAMLIDALRICGLEALAESHLGTRQNRHQPLRALGEMAFAVLAAVERRLDGPRSATAGDFLRPWDGGSVVNVPVDERPPLRLVLRRAA
jgi:glucosyl-3-phosphoglycerate synthase